MPADWEPYDRHWIRLRGPWQVSWLTTEPGPIHRTVTLPAGWATLFGDRPGTARFVRRFQKPSRLDADERVCVTLLDVHADVGCQLNEVSIPALPLPLGDPGCWPGGVCLSFDVTDHLQTSNLLVLDITIETVPIGAAGLHQPVLLEIVTLDDGAAD